MISEPLRKLDCCLVTDGAGAVVMTRADRAADLRRKPVRVLGSAEGHTHRFISDMPDLLTTAAATTVPAALRAAKVGLDEIDVFQIYDAFTIGVLLMLEDMGLCPRGEAGAFVKSGATAFGGVAPLNTNGGGLSYAHPGMNGIFLLIEAVHQLRQDSPGLVVKGAETALVHGLGGPLSSGATVILGLEDVS
jgi:acetyl-CoA acetyltransferase